MLHELKCLFISFTVLIHFPEQSLYALRLASIIIQTNCEYSMQLFSLLGSFINIVSLIMLGHNDLTYLACCSKIKMKVNFHSLRLRGLHGHGHFYMVLISFRKRALYKNKGKYPNLFP